MRSEERIRKPQAVQSKAIVIFLILHREIVQPVQLYLHFQPDIRAADFLKSLTIRIAPDRWSHSLSVWRLSLNSCYPGPRRLVPHRIAWESSSAHHDFENKLWAEGFRSR